MSPHDHADDRDHADDDERVEEERERRGRAVDGERQHHEHDADEREQAEAERTRSRADRRIELAREVLELRRARASLVEDRLQAHEPPLRVRELREPFERTLETEARFGHQAVDRAFAVRVRRVAPHALELRE